MPKPTAVFSALANKTRLEILLALRKHEMNVSELIKELGAQQSAISHNLKKLADAGLVNIRRQKKFTFAALDRAKADLVMQLLNSSTGNLDEKAAQVLENTENRMRRLAEILPMPAMIVMGAKVYYANQAAVSLFGYPSPRKLIGRKITEMLDPEAMILILERRQQLLAGKRLDPVEHKIVRGDRSTASVESNVTLVKLNGGYAFFIAFRDLTVQKEKERVLREDVRWFNRIADSAACGVLVTDKSGVIRYANGRLASFLGRKAGELQGRKFNSFLHRSGIPGAVQIPRQMRRGYSLTRDWVFRPLHAKPIRLLFSSGPIYDRRGKYQGQLSILMEHPASERQSGSRHG